MTTTVFRLALLGLIACAEPTKILEPVGGECQTDAACDVGLFCETQLPGGACTFACDGLECPSGSYCIEVTYSVDGVERSAIRCLQSCDDRACRSGWRCIQALPEPYKVCLP